VCHERIQDLEVGITKRAKIRSRLWKPGDHTELRHSGNKKEKKRWLVYPATAVKKGSEKEKAGSGTRDVLLADIIPGGTDRKKKKSPKEMDRGRVNGSQKERRHKAVAFCEKKGNKWASLKKKKDGRSVPNRADSVVGKKSGGGRKPGRGSWEKETLEKRRLSRKGLQMYQADQRRKRINRPGKATSDNG